MSTRKSGKRRSKNGTASKKATTDPVILLSALARILTRAPACSGVIPFCVTCD
jgi:hypothetical protein